MKPVLKRILEEKNKEHEILLRLVEPARAAANQMKDAGMQAGADPLLKVLFEHEAWRQGFEELIKSDPVGLIRAMVESIKEGL